MSVKVIDNKSGLNYVILMAKSKKITTSNPVGAPTKYKSEYCQEIVDFFSIEPYQLVPETITGKNFEKESMKQIPNPFPTFEKFAAINDLHTDTLHEWKKVHPEFSEAYKKAQQLQKNFLMQNGLSGLYNAAAFCFVAKNCTDMRDKTEVEHSGIPMPPIEIVYRVVK